MDLDLPARLSPNLPVWVTQLAVGTASAGAAWMARLALDTIAPGAAPFALVFPAVLLATLLARWPAGAIAGTCLIAGRWFLTDPDAILAGRDAHAAALSVVAVAISTVLTIAIAELFRATVRRATAERDRQIADRDLFLAEFDHRMKNNFAIVAGLLDMQKRRAVEPATAAALEVAQSRVDSIARAHRHLYRGGGGGQPGVVEIRDYLDDLCQALAESLFLRGGITLDCDTDAASVPRDRAVSIGLIINELVTNAAKHAFPGRDFGTIRVTFRNRPEGGWIVVVADDGVGLPDVATPSGLGNGLGTRLTEAFARQAGGTITVDSDRTGTSVQLVLTG